MSKLKLQQLLNAENCLTVEMVKIVYGLNYVRLVVCGHIIMHIGWIVNDKLADRFVAAAWILSRTFSWDKISFLNLRWSLVRNFINFNNTPFT